MVFPREVSAGYGTIKVRFEARLASLARGHGLRHGQGRHVTPAATWGCGADAGQRLAKIAGVDEFDDAPGTSRWRALAG